MIGSEATRVVVQAGTGSVSLLLILYKRPIIEMDYQVMYGMLITVDMVTTMGVVTVVYIYVIMDDIGVCMRLCGMSTLSNLP